MSVLIVGSTALDSIKTPKAENPRLLGGSASHAAVAASYFAPVKMVGIVGKDLSLEDGQAAARLCAINVLAQLKTAVGGNLDRVRRCVKLGVFVNAAPGFAQHPEVANGASDLIQDVFGDAGRHARAAVGAGSLPRNVAAEVEAVFEIA